jgi:hypothetical protein
MSRWGVASGGCKPEGAPRSAPMQCVENSIARARRAMSRWVVAPIRCTVGVKELTLKASGEARGKPPRGRGWLRSHTASPYEAGFDLREIAPLSRHNLPPPGVAPKECTGQRAGCRQGATATGDTSVPGPTDEASNLDIPGLRSGFRHERRGSLGNRCLRYFAECIGVNVGGSHMERSSPSMKSASVGGVIVLGRRESRLHGEGRQGLDASRVAMSGHMPVKSGATR